MTVLGTRPEIIRLSLVIKVLDEHTTHIVVHTGQNHAECLNDIFFKDLGIRAPDYALGIRAETAGEQIGRILIETEKVLLNEMPDRFLILGDTNSSLGAICAKRLGIPVYHMEAGNRCYDDRVPEEINRRIIDHSSDVLMPYTYRSKENLVREGIARERIFVTGNPIYEVLNHFSQSIAASRALQTHDLQPRQYFLVTMHRAENVDDEHRLGNFVTALDLLSSQYELPIICSLHPRTQSTMSRFGFSFEHKYVRYLEPFGFFDFVTLEKNSFCVLTDSGTVQEECSILNVPCVTVRDVTERPETVECGSNVISGDDPSRIVRIVEMVTKFDTTWQAPAEYLEQNVSEKVMKILYGATCLRGSPEHEPNRVMKSDPVRE